MPLDTPQHEVDRVIQANPHHVNWFFLHKLDGFKNVWIEAICKGKTENGGWWWYRMEWQFRGRIHGHGLVKIGGDAPDTYALADQAVERQRLLDQHKPEYTQEEQEAIKLGEAAAQTLCDFHDSLVCTDTSMPYSEWIPPAHDVPKRPKPMSFRPADVKNTKRHRKRDIDDLTFSLQRHKCGICLKTIDGVQTCKLKFPKPLSSVTKLVITR